MALDFKGNFQGPVSLIAAPQALTANWVDLGDEQFVQGARHLGLYVDLDINDSTNARVRALAKLTDGGALEYVLPIRTVAGAIVQLEDQVLEFNVDADQQMVLSWELDGLVPRVQFQVQAGVVGAAAGQIETAWVTTGL